VKKYFFGYLFVRIAKLLAIIIVIAGVGFALLEYSQASVASASRAYQPSDLLRRDLDHLKHVFSKAQELVSSFNRSNKSSSRQVTRAEFPAVVGSNRGFDRLDRALASLDQEKQLLKQSMVNRFDTLTSEIEQKLRSHAAALQPSPPPVVPPSHPVSQTPAPQTTVVHQQNSLFSRGISSTEIEARRSKLIDSREFLRVLENKAENPENKSKLAESAAQVDALARLLVSPEREEPTPVMQSQSAPSAALPQAGQVNQVVTAETIADQLERLRETVKNALTNSWALDDAFDEALSVSKTEKQLCHVASLEQERIWLSATGQIGTSLLAAVLAAFLILVFADLTQTLLDTATNTGVIAGAAKTQR
jgi:hypothetical protein